MSFIQILVILFSVSLNTFAQLFLKKGADTCIAGKTITFDIFLLCISNLYFWLGFLCYAISILSWIFILGKMSVSLAYPFLSFGFVLSMILAYFLFGEPITATKVMGIGLICFGLFTLSFSGR